MNLYIKQLTVLGFDWAQIESQKGHLAMEKKSKGHGLGAKIAAQRIIGEQMRTGDRDDGGSSQKVRLKD